MKLYIAAAYTSNFGLKSNLFNNSPPAAQALRACVSHHLESYHYLKKGRFAEAIRADGIKVFVDSGAFSAFSLGHEIDIKEYAQFLRDNRDIVEMASVLDAIGDPVGTFENQKRLEDMDLPVDILPCFHFGEPWELAEYYVTHYPYITIGGMVPISNDKLELWLDELWDRVLTDENGQARCKVHGFGLTSGLLMAKYPWYSVDSSTWVQAAAHGFIFLPEVNFKIPISGRSTNTKDHDAHYDTYPLERQQVIEDLLAYYGLTINDVRDKHHSRWCLNAFTFDRIGKLLGDGHWRKPFKAEQKGLFS